MEIEQILAKLDDGSAVKKRAPGARPRRKPLRHAHRGRRARWRFGGHLRARARASDTGIVAERFGGQVMDTLAIENLDLGPWRPTGPSLAAALEQHVRATPSSSSSTSASRRSPPAHRSSCAWRAAPRSARRASSWRRGARWRDMNVPGEAEYRTKGGTYCPHCDGPLFKGKRVAVVGGGNSGVEAAIDLAGVVGHVTLLELAPALRRRRGPRSQAQEHAQRRDRHARAHHRGGGRRAEGRRPPLGAHRDEGAAPDRDRGRVRADRPAPQHR